MKQSVGGNAGLWFPTRNKLAGFDVGAEIAGCVWWPDIACCRPGVNGTLNPDGMFEGTTTEIQGIYIGGNVMLRRPFAISGGISQRAVVFLHRSGGGGAHQFAFRRVDPEE